MPHWNSSRNDPASTGRGLNFPVHWTAASSAKVGSNSLAGLIIDVAGFWPDERTERLLDTALRTKQLRMESIERRHAQLPRCGRVGTSLLDRLILERIDGQHRSANELEAETRKVLRRAGLPDPVRQFRVVLPSGKERFLDLAYPDLMIAIEVDGYEWHSTRSDWVADQIRNNELVALGWRIFRVTAEVRSNPEAFLSQIASALGM